MGVGDEEGRELLLRAKAVAEEAFELSSRIRGLLLNLESREGRFELGLALARGVFGKWSMEVLAALYLYGPMGFSELRRRLSGITSRTLSSKLKVLEVTGLVRREAYTKAP